MYGVRPVPAAGAETGVDPSWHEVGSLRLASAAERYEELERQAGWAKTFGLPLELIRAEEARDRFPLMTTDGVLGAVWLPTDGWLDPSGLAQALAAGARAARRHDPPAHARRRASASSGGRVTGVDGRARAASATTIAADVVVNAGGMFAPEIGRLAGVTVPIIPMAHQYLFTEPIEGVDPSLPTLRDPDNLVLLPRGGRRPVHGRLRARPGALVARRHPGRLQRPAAGSGLAALRARSWTGAIRRVPGDRRRGRHPDDQRPRGVHAGQRVHPRRVGGPRVLRRGRLLRPRHRRRRRHRPPGGDAGSSRASPSSTCGRWTSAGSARAVPVARRTRWPASIENYATYYDIHYPNEERQAGRPLRTLADLRAPRRARRASFGEKSGWERPNWFEPNADGAGVATRPLEALRPRGWAGQHWTPGDRRRGAGDAPGGRPVRRDELRQDRGRRPGRAAAFLQRLCANDVDRAGRRRSSTPRCSTGAAGSSATSPSPGSRPTGSCS